MNTMQRIAATSLAWTFAISAAHADGMSIAQNNLCFKCHSIERDKKGPSFKRIAQSNRGYGGAEKEVKAVIRNGIKSYFFFERMPPSNMSDADLTELTRWILSH